VRVTLFFVLAVGCPRVAPLELELILEPSARSVVLVSDDGETLQAFAQDVVDGRAARFELFEQYVGAYPVELTAFVYGSPLDTFGFEAGGLAIVEDGVPIPSTIERQRAVIRGGNFEPWRSIGAEEIGDRLSAMRVESSRQDDECLDQGRCFDLDSGSPEACIVCPPPPEPMPPAAPSPPALSCDGGWVLREENGTSVCAPEFVDWPPQVACPAGAFADPLPPGALRVGPGGDYATIAEALLAANPGDVVALAKQTFEETIEVPDGVAVRGACATTVVRGATLNDGASLEDLTVDAITVSGSGVVRGAVIGTADVEAGASLSLDRCSVSGRIDNAGQLALTDVRTDSEVMSSYGRLDARRVFAKRFHFQGGSAVLQQIAIDGGNEAGIGVRLGATATIAGAWIEDSEVAQIQVGGAGSFANIEDAVLSDSPGDGVRVVDRGRVRVSRTIIERTIGAGVFIEDAGSHADLFDLTIRDVFIRADRFSSNGIHMEEGTSSNLERASITRVAGKALDLDGSTADLRDVAIDDAGTGDCHQCSGVCGYSIAMITAERLRIANTRGRAISCRDRGCFVRATEARIENTIASADCTLENPNSTPRLGQGLVAAEGGSSEISRFVISGCTGAGVALEEFDPESFGTSLLVSDGAIEDNASGAHLQVPDYPLARVANRVIYRNNRVSVVR
jgi:hypothetical protein